MRMLLVASVSNIILILFYFRALVFPGWSKRCRYRYSHLLAHRLPLCSDFYRRGKGIFSLDFRRFALRWQQLKEIISVGAPASLNQSFLSFSLLIFNFILMQLPQETLL